MDDFPPSFPKQTPFAFRIRDVAQLTGLSRATLYRAIKTGDLVARKYGARTLVNASDLAAFIADLPTQQPNDRAGSRAITPKSAVAQKTVHVAASLLAGERQ